MVEARIGIDNSSSKGDIGSHVHMVEERVSVNYNKLYADIAIVSVHGVHCKTYRPFIKQFFVVKSESSPVVQYTDYIRHHLFSCLSKNHEP